MSEFNNTEREDFIEHFIGSGIQRKLSPVRLLELMLTADCNLRCSYCFVHKKRQESMSWETLKRSLEFLSEASRDINEVGILFFGGEPLLAYDLIQKAVDYSKLVLKDKVVSFSMTTNGLLLDEEKCKYFSKERVKYLLSVDGIKENHDRYRRTVEGGGSYDRIMSNFKTMEKYQPWQGTRLTVAPDLASELFENVQGLYLEGFKQFIIGPTHGCDWNDLDIETYEKEMCLVIDFYLEMLKQKKPIRITLYEQGNLDSFEQKHTGVWGCGAGRARLCVTPDGSLYGCSKLATIQGLDDGILKLGDVEAGLTNWRSRLQLNDHTEARREPCQTCKYKNVCSGGCPATNYSVTGSIFLPEPDACRFQKIYFQLREYAEKKRKELGLWFNESA